MSFSNHTLSLFTGLSNGATDQAMKGSEGSTPREITPGSITHSRTKGVVERASSFSNTGADYRPPKLIEMVGTYGDPRIAPKGFKMEDKTHPDQVVQPIYDGPSYTKRADGDLMGRVMKDIANIKDNQLDSLQKSFKKLVENAIGRDLKEGEKPTDHWDAISNINTDRSGFRLGMAASGLNTTIGHLLSEEAWNSVVTLTKDYMDSTTHEQRVARVLHNKARFDVQNVKAAIHTANLELSNGYGVGAELLPPLTEDEAHKLQELFLERRTNEYNSGKGTISFDHTLIDTPGLEQSLRVPTDFRL